MSSSGEMIRAWQGAPTFKVLKNTKDQGLQNDITGLEGDYSNLNASNDAAIKDWSTKYLAGQPAAEAQTRLETGAIGRYYNGDIERALAGLRASQSAATNAAAQRGVQYALRGNNLSALGAGGGDSSYLRSLLGKNAGDIEAQAAITSANQARGDYGAVLAGQERNAGRINSMIDATTGRLLAPMAVSNAEQARRIASLGGIMGLDQSNNFYGLQQNKTGIDKVADFSNALGQTVMDVASIYGSAMGGGGMGGGHSQTGNPNQAYGMQQTGAGSNWSGYNSSSPQFTPSYMPGNLGGYSYSGSPGGKIYNFGGGNYAPPSDSGFSSEEDWLK